MSNRAKESSGMIADIAMTVGVVADATAAVSTTVDSLRPSKTLRGVAR